jgi:hypothetical protein
MIRELLPFVGQYKEAVKPIDVTDIKNPEFLDGVIEFRFDYINNSKAFSQPITGLEKTQKTKTILVYDELNFKPGDRIIIDGKNYNVQRVDLEVEDKYKKIVKRYPNAWKNYAYKRIEIE